MRHVLGAVDGIRVALEWAGLEYDYGVCRCILDINREESSVCNRSRERGPARAVLSSLFSNRLNVLTFTKAMPTSSSRYFPHLILIYSLLMPLFESQDIPTVVFSHQIP